MHVRLLITAIMLLLCALPGWAQQLILSTELDYLMVDQRFRDPDRRLSTSGAFPRLGLSLTGPARPGARLYLDLTGGLSENTFGISRQSNDDVRLVVRGETRRYRLSLRHGQTHFASAADGLDLTSSRLTSDTRETGLALILREPSWPVVNLQYSRFVADSALGGVSTGTETTSSRVAAIYDLKPLRFRFDENRFRAHVVGGDASESGSRRLGLSLDTALLSGLDLFADLQLTRRENRSGSGTPTGSDDHTALVRLSAEPTPKAVIDAEARLQSVDNFGGIGSTLSVKSALIAMRSEVVPGIQLNLGRQGDEAKRAGFSTKTSETDVDLFARIDARNNLLISFSPRRITLSDGPAIEQQASHLSWTSQLDGHTDLTASWDRFSDEDPAAGLHRTTNKYLALRYRPDLQTTIGLALLWSNSNLEGLGGSSAEEVRQLDSDISWLASQDLSLGLRFSLTRLSGASGSRIRVPALDLRWRPDMQSELAINWRLQSAVQRDLDNLNRFDFTTLAGRFRHDFGPGSSVSIDYSVLKVSQGALAYERLLRISYTTKLGR